MSQLIDDYNSNDMNNYLGFSEYSPKAKAMEAATKCVQFGLSTYQISGDLPLNFPENVPSGERVELFNFNSANDLRLHFHAPTDIPLASRHERLRLSGVERLYEFLDLAISCGAKSFIFHPGRFAYYRIGSGQVVVANRNIPEVYFERFFDSVERLVKFADGKIELLLENTYDFSDQLIGIIDKFLGLQSTGLVWDIGHMQRSMLVAKRRKIDPTRIADFFSKRIKNIKLVHLHDINAEKGHLALGTGVMDFTPYLDVLSGLKIDMIIEVFSEKDLKTSIDYIESLTVKG